MNLSKAVHAMLDEVTSEEKEEAIRFLQERTGSQHNRVLLAIIRDLRRELDPLQKLLHCMGDLTIEEASLAIQQHSPWNGRSVCDVHTDAESALEEIEKVFHRRALGRAALALGLRTANTKKEGA